MEARSAKPSVVEGLGRWLGWTDAIALAAALREPPDAPRDAPAKMAPERAVERVRAALGRAIDTAAASADETDFAPHRRRYIGLQQAMEDAIGPLRAELRAALVALSPALAQLATIDAVIEQALGAREQALLAALPGLLEKRLQHWLAAAPGDDALAAFRQDMQRLLHAELALRLQPVQGLLEAWRMPQRIS